MKSMTGYGKGVAALCGAEVTIELRTVNNRFLDINSRLPKNLLAIDEIIRTAIQRCVGRGNVDVFFNYTRACGDKSISADFALIQGYADLLKSIRDKTGLDCDISLSTLINQGLITQDTGADDEMLPDMVKTAIGAAIENLNKMREDEGAAICADLKRLIAEVECGVEKVSKRAVDVLPLYRKRLAEKIQAVLSEVDIDEARLLNEVAFFADKSDINEELQRLCSHINQFRVTLDSSGATGRKLDFICQEIGREINTTGSKSNDLEITAAVMELKNTLEKIKEQVRNVE